MQAGDLGTVDVAKARGSARPWLPFVIVGAASVLAGGFVAAAGGEAPSRHLSWACAYLVLVCGSAQVFLGAGRVLVAVRPPAPRLVAWQVVVFNLGNAAVLAGALLPVPTVLYAGSALVVTALGSFAWDARGPTVRPGALVVYRVGIIALAVSVPVGNVLVH